MAFEWQNGVGQTSVVTQPNPGAAGELAYANDEEVKINSYLNAEVSLSIPFGRMVAKNAGQDGQALFPNTADDLFVGVTVRDLQKLSGDYPIANQMGVLNFGQVWVEAELDVSADDNVFVRFAGKKQVQTLVASADFVAGNTITGKVNGNNISVPFNANAEQTLDDLATAIGLIAGVNSAVDDDVHTITITSDQDVTLALTVFVVTGGASQATFVITQTTAGILLSARGSFRNDADSGTAEQVKFCRFKTSTTSFPNSTKKLAIVDVLWPEVDVG